MKITALLMLPAGWIICLASLPLLAAPAPRTVFLLAGFGIEILGLVMLFRAHAIMRGEKG